jgi:rhamnose utilization protein RhaD (predicted bifunctional aldolase and dehydrogenase)
MPQVARRLRAAELAPVIRGLASTDRRQVGHFDDSAVVLDFLASSRLFELGGARHSCPDHFLRTKVRPMVLDLPRIGAAGRGDSPAA